LAVQAAAAKPAASTAGRGVGEAGLDVGATGPAVQAAATRITAVRTTGVHGECARPEAGPREDCRQPAPQNTPRIRSSVISLSVAGDQALAWVGGRRIDRRQPPEIVTAAPGVVGIVTRGTRELPPIDRWSWNNSATAMAGIDDRADLFVHVDAVSEDRIEFVEQEGGPRRGLRLG
jgi:hypothetical protein